jgi:hypothetical protein
MLGTLEDLHGTVRHTTYEFRGEPLREAMNLLAKPTN